ncbi:hypothetical protein HEQ75_16250 [Roseomonas sp. BU-1]|uniref:PhnA-like protein n=1 Tax=Falsiroseomonas selenitidurans TaxID=2716335 RepID=A0ABX1E5F1_9PROT|nr:hypothetical protein [Falsiroseomonas selenitidurans]
MLSGGLVAVTVGTMFNILGAAIGASTIDPIFAGGTPDAGTFGIAGGIWLLLASLLGLACGGYVAARLSGTADDTDGVLHGLSVWAIAFLVSALMLGNLVAGTARGVGAAAQGIGSAVAGAAGTAGEAASRLVPEIGDPEALVERLQAGLQSGGDPAALNEDQRRAEITRLVTQRATQGALAPAERERLTTLAAAEFDIAPAQAEQRIAALEAEAQRLLDQAERRAREAADAAANAAAVAAYWAFAAMALGAAAAVLGAKVGTRKTILLAGRRAYS